MKKIFFLIGVLLLFICCKTTILPKIESGTYIYKYDDGDIEKLSLKEDGTFVFNSYMNSCEGKWRYIAKDTILIKCKDATWQEVIQRGYMTVRERKIKVLSKERLKMLLSNNTKRKYIILERVEPFTIK